MNVHTRERQVDTVLSLIDVLEIMKGRNCRYSSTSASGPYDHALELGAPHVRILPVADSSITSGPIELQQEQGKSLPMHGTCIALVIIVG